MDNVFPYSYRNCLFPFWVTLYCLSFVIKPIMVEIFLYVSCLAHLFSLSIVNIGARRPKWSCMEIVLFPKQFHDSIFTTVNLRNWMGECMHERKWINELPLVCLGCELKIISVKQKSQERLLYIQCITIIFYCKAHLQNVQTHSQKQK